MTSRLRTLLGCAALLLASAFTAGVASAQSINITGCQSLSAPVVSGTNITITCNPNQQGPGAPTCSGANLQTVGTTLTFTATCTKGTNPITSITESASLGQGFCSGGSCPATSTIPVSVTGIPIPTVTTVYSVTASDGTLSSNPASATYSVGGGGGGAVDLSACVNMGYPNSAYYDVNYPNGANINVYNVYHSATPGGRPFGNSSALVIRFTTPALGVNDGTNANFQAWAPDSNNNHQATLGTAPCLVPQANSLTPADASSPQLPVIKTSLSQTPAFPIQITGNGLCDPTKFNCAGTSTTFLLPNTTYYITLVNKSASWTGTPNCGGSGDCDMRFNFNN